MNRYLQVFTNGRMLTTLLLGFSGGIPLALTGSTLQAWLADAKVDIATIGQFALVGLPYAMKFLWAPFMDIQIFPFLGLRRSWMILCQAGLFLATLGLAFTDPAASISLFSLFALLVAFSSASQDIVIDAYRTEVIHDQKELGAGAGLYIAGYRIAMVVSGGLALVMADHISWQNVYIAMALVNLVGMVTILMSPEPVQNRKVSQLSLKENIVAPFIEFFHRHGAMEILIFIMIYKLSTLMATALTTNFLLELGYTKTLIGTVNKGFGLVATIGGTLAGGAMMINWGLKRSLWIFGIIQATVGLSFCLLAYLAIGHEHMKDFWLVMVICVDNFFMGLGTAALTGFMMNFCSKQFTATQYALLTSVMAVSRVILIAQAGTLVKLMGWNLFFIATVPLAIPGLLLLNRFDQWQLTSAANAKEKIPTFEWALIGMFVFSLIALSSDPIFQWLGLKAQGQQAVFVGAVGVVIVVAVGLLRPYLGMDKPKATAKSA